MTNLRPKKKKTKEQRRKKKEERREKVFPIDARRMIFYIRKKKV